MPKLISNILSTMSPGSKDKIMAQPNYAEAIDHEDVIELAIILENVFARQKGMGLAVFICKFQEMLQILKVVGVKPDCIEISRTS